MIEITQEQRAVSLMTIRNTYMRVELLDFNLLVVDRLEGNVTAGSINIDATADIRRTCSITMVLTDNSFVPESGGKIWLDKYVRLSIGVDDVRIGDVVWTNLGIYLINQPSYEYDAVTKTLTFAGVDLMAKMTGARNGYLTGIVHSVPMGSVVRDVIITILRENGFNRYLVSQCQNVDGTIVDVPYDMEFDKGSTWFDVLSKLRDILPNYQMYFDVDGVFHYEPIPVSSADPIMVDDTVWKQNVISEAISVDFESVKNSIEVYGATHDVSHYGSKENTTVSGNAISSSIASITALSNGVLVGFALPTNAVGNLTLNISNLGAHPIVDYNGRSIGFLEANTIWCVVYQASTSSWLFLGHLQAEATIKDENPNSPFYVNGTGGEIKLVLFGSEYEDIQSDYLAQERVRFELYKHCRLNDTMNLTSVPIYWMDVNIKSSFTSTDSKESKVYTIQSVNMDLAPDGQMTVNMAAFFPYYPEY